MKNRLVTGIIVLFVLLNVLYISYEYILFGIGRVLIRDDRPLPVKADAAVVLHTGADIHPRLMEAARLFGSGAVERIIVNGNRKNEAMRQLEKQGYAPPCPWQADYIRVLTLLGVPEDRITAIEIEDAYDTVSEAVKLQSRIDPSIKSLVITTSKFHSRRAVNIWEARTGGRFEIYSVPATDDPFDPWTWWKSGAQAKQVLSEYGAGIYDIWKSVVGTV